MLFSPILGESPTAATGTAKRGKAQQEEDTWGHYKKATKAFQVIVDRREDTDMGVKFWSIQVCGMHLSYFRQSI